MNTNTSERGQAIVLIVLAIVALFGFAALAIDGGYLYSERGRAQNAADSAALAAAAAAANGQDPAARAFALAAMNGFNNDGVTNIVTYHNPPIDGPYAAAPNNSIYYQVKIITNVQPIFSQFVRSGGLQTTVQAVTMYQPSQAVTGNNAIVTLETTAGQDGMLFNGDVKLFVYNGNIWSNNNAAKTGKASGCSHGVCPGIYVHSSAVQDSVSKPCTVSACDGNIYTVGAWGANQDKVMGNFQPGQPAMAVPNIPMPYCPPWDGKGYDKFTYQYGSEAPVDYYVGKASDIPSKPAPGIHCLYGDITKNIDATGVLLVLIDGGVKYTGNGQFFVRAASRMVDKNGNDWGRMAIYAPAGNTSAFEFKGNSESLYTGSVFVPGMTCDIGGTPDNTANDTALVCYRFRMHGNPYINITFNANNQYQLLGVLGLMQ